MNASERLRAIEPLFGGCGWSDGRNVFAGNGFRGKSGQLRVAVVMPNPAMYSLMGR
jgi:hypothetical protein